MNRRILAGVSLVTCLFLAPLAAGQEKEVCIGGPGSCSSEGTCDPGRLGDGVTAGTAILTFDYLPGPSTLTLIVENTSEDGGVDCGGGNETKHPRIRDLYFNADTPVTGMTLVSATDGDSIDRTGEYTLTFTAPRDVMADGLGKFSAGIQGPSIRSATATTWSGNPVTGPVTFVFSVAGDSSQINTCSFTTVESVSSNGLIFSVAASHIFGGGCNGAFSAFINDGTCESCPPPEISCPSGTVMFECQGPEGALVTFDVTATSECYDSSELTIVCEPFESGDTVPAGTDVIITCTVTDPEGQTAECSFRLKVWDTLPPTITCPDDITAECTGPDGADVTFEVTTGDICCPDQVTVECVPPSGSTFPIGTTTVTCTATDWDGNEATCDFTVTVEDSTPPEITCPDDIVMECTGPDGADVTWETTATDVCGDVTVECDPEPGTFPCSEFTVTCTATDAAGNTSECSFTVTVQDTTPPEINCPEDICVDGSDVPVVVDFETTATDICDLDVDVMCMPPSGSVFNPGTTTVVCAAFDDKGNMAMCHFDVTVKTCVNFDEDVNGMIPDPTFITDQYEILGILIEGISDTGNTGVLARTTGLPGSTREDLIPSSGPNYVQTWSGGDDSDSGVITFQFIDPDTMSPQTASYVELTFLDIESSGQGSGGTNRSRLKAYDENGDLLDRVNIPFGTNGNQFTASIGAPDGPLRIAKVEAAIGNATDSGGVDEFCFTPNGPAITARLMGPPEVHAGEDLVLYRCIRNNTDLPLDVSYTLRGTPRRNKPGKRIQGPIATTIGPSYDNFDSPDVLSFFIRGDKPGFWNRNAFIIVEYHDQATGNLIAQGIFPFRLLPPR